MYLPTSISEYNIYDVYYNDVGDYVIIMAAEISPPPIIELLCFQSLFHVMIDPERQTHHYIFTLHQSEFRSRIDLSISGKLYSSVRVNRYPLLKNKFLASTMVKHEDSYIRQWIRYHKHIGIEHFIIYDNAYGNDENRSYYSQEDTSNVEEVLKKEIEDGIVTLIQWSYPKRLKKSGISGQTTQQNHSIYAFQTSSYICFTDIDEYINPLQYKNIPEAINSVNVLHQNNSEYFTYILLNKFFYNPFEESCKDFDFLSIGHCDRFCTMGGRFKNIVVPKNTSSICIHVVYPKCGKKYVSYRFSPNLMRFHHYFYLNKKDRGRKKTNNNDLSILKVIESMDMTL